MAPGEGIVLGQLGRNSWRWKDRGSGPGRHPDCAGGRVTAKGVCEPFLDRFGRHGAPGSDRLPGERAGTRVRNFLDLPVLGVPLGPMR